MAVLMAKHGFYNTPAWRALRVRRLQIDGYRCQAPGCNKPATHVDHIETRPAVDCLTAADRVDNLRSLCATHDAQVKETPTGRRRNGGRFVARGVDADGWPLQSGCQQRNHT